MREYIVEDFSRKTIDDFFSDPDRSISLWSPHEVELLRVTSPLTVRRINECTGSCYAIAEEHLLEQAKSLSGFLTMSIDNSIFKGVMSVPMVKSKVRNLENLAEAQGRQPYVCEADVNERNLIDVACFTKLAALNAHKGSVQAFERYETLYSSGANPFHGFFEGLFGDNLRGIIHYGTIGDDAKDYDLMVLLERLSRHEYDIISGMSCMVSSDKPVGIVLLEHQFIQSYAACDYYSRAIATQGKLIQGGPIEFPVLSEDDYVRKMYFKLGKSLTSLRGSLSDTERLVKMSQNPEFLYDTFKQEIWVRKALLQSELGQVLTKPEFLDIEPIQIPDVGGSWSVADAREALYDANCRVNDRIEQHIRDFGVMYSPG